MNQPSPAPRRYLALWLERLSTDRIERSAPPEARTSPRVTVAPEKGALRVAALNRPAAALGLGAGMALTDARARHPDIAVAAHDLEADAKTLSALADACERYTPLLALDGADGLLLDISGCAHLFGGEAGLLRDLLSRMAGAGFRARGAIAGTPEAAGALVRFCGRRASIVPEETDLARVLAPLPVAALRLPEPQLAALARLGFTRLADLMDKPRAPLAARFGTSLLERLDAATGAVRTALAHRQPPPRFSAEKPLAEPVEQVEDVLGLVQHLAASLAVSLERHGLGARRMDLALFRVDGKVTRLSVGSGRPVREPAFMRRLFAEKVAALGTLDPGFGFDLVRLTVPLAEPLVQSQEDFDSGRAADLALDALLDRLAARLGRGQVLVPVPVNAHVPEEACRLVPAGNASRSFSPLLLDAPPLPEGDMIGPSRPARLFERPEPVEAVAEVPDGPPTRFRWRRLVHHVAAAEGPERISPPWWRADGFTPTRDYFRIETTDGLRFWLFRSGLFGAEVSHPAWFVHGLFG